MSDITTEEDQGVSGQLGAGTDKSRRLSGQMTVHPGNATTGDEVNQK